SPAGAFTYTPAANATGTDSFSFTASDGTLTSPPATVTVTIKPVNDPPLANSTSLTVNEDTRATGQLSATDADGDTLTFTLAAPPARGTATISPAGAFTYTPEANATGTDSFSFTASDGTLTSPLANSTSLTVNEDTRATGQLSATDADGDTLTFTLAAPPARGTATISPAGAFTYTPAANATGTDSFSFTVSDGTVTSPPATVTVTIKPVNDPPLANSTSLAVDQGATISGHLDGTDPDGDPLSFILVSSPAKGTVNLAADGSYTYRANSDASGTDTFSFKVSDGRTDSNTATVTVKINEVSAGFRFETGELQVTSAWQKVNFDTPFLNPVVIARATSLNDPEPGVIRVRNVTTTGFELRFQEWDSLDGIHPAETVTYLVMEQGSFTLANGTMVEAGCFPATTTGTFAPVSFAKPMHRVPVVMTAVDTVNETDGVTTRIRNITAAGFEVMMQEQEANPAEHAPETACFIAWEPSSGTIGTMLYDVTTTADEITHNAVREKYPVQFPTPPLLLAEMESTDGADTAVLRVSANSVTGATLLVEEEQSRDSEEYHTTETAGMIAIDTIDPAADPDGDGLSTAEETGTYHTHPGLADSDSDGLPDGREVAYWQDQGTSWAADPDGDGLVNLLDPDSDGDGIPDGTEVAGGTDPGDPASTPGFPTIDAGEIELDHNLVHVDFSTPFTRPVVVARLVSRNGWDPSVLRITNVTPTGFDIRLQEYDYLNGTHILEQVNYLVMEAGHYTLSDGTQIEAGTFENRAVSSFGRQDFTRPFSRVPVVVTAIVSDNETDAVTGRLRNINQAGFDFRMQEQELNPQVHAPESVSYIAWEPSAATIAGIRFAVGRSTDSITGVTATVPYNGSFPRQPLLVAAMQTTDGGDTASLRITGHTADDMQVMVEEERSRDSETSHTTEVAGYIAILAE
ncbi:MAG TPA: tandem-95 repeat protein, partial [Desulfobulbus sp.]|nr:tandem-95 repeat protein [Desulfobulbus sp.]